MVAGNSAAGAVPKRFWIVQLVLETRVSLGGEHRFGGFRHRAAVKLQTPAGRWVPLVVVVVVVVEFRRIGRRTGSHVVRKTTVGKKTWIRLTVFFFSIFARRRGGRTWRLCDVSSSLESKRNREENRIARLRGEVGCFFYGANKLQTKTVVARRAISRRNDTLAIMYVC